MYVTVLPPPRNFRTRDLHLLLGVRIHTKQRIESVLTNLHNDILHLLLINFIFGNFLHIIHCVFVVTMQTLLCTRLAACHVPLVIKYIVADIKFN